MQAIHPQQALAAHRGLGRGGGRGRGGRGGRAGGRGGRGGRGRREGRAAHPAPRINSLEDFPALVEKVSVDAEPSVQHVHAESWVAAATGLIDPLCVVCQTRAPASTGAYCCEALGTPRHFACGECLSGMVTAYCAMDGDSIVIGKLREDSLDALISCPAYTDSGLCTQRFKNSGIVRHVSCEAYDAMQNAIFKLTEQRLMRDFDSLMRNRVRLELKKYSNMDDRTRLIEEHKTHILEEFLNLRCSRCRAVFVDFDGCFAVSCSSCGAGLCVCCLADCGTDAHDHVLTCPYNIDPGDYGDASLANIDSMHKLRREAAVREYLDANVLDNAVRDEILKELTPYFTDLGMDVAALVPEASAAG